VQIIILILRITEPIFWEPNFSSFLHANCKIYILRFNSFEYLSWTHFNTRRYPCGAHYRRFIQTKPAMDNGREWAMYISPYPWHNEKSARRILIKFWNGKIYKRHFKFHLRRAGLTTTLHFCSYSTKYLRYRKTLPTKLQREAKRIFEVQYNFSLSLTVKGKAIPVTGREGP
jgi:hypothetical protein